MKTSHGLTQSKDKSTGTMATCPVSRYLSKGITVKCIYDLPYAKSNIISRGMSS